MTPAQDATPAPILEGRHLSKVYRPRTRGVSRRPVPALDDVSVEVAAGEVVAIVGESGSGKTTLTRCLLGIERASSGVVLLDGEQVGECRDKNFHRHVQAVFQDPFSSLDPRWPVRDTIRESLDYLGIGDCRRQRDEIVNQQLIRVGLPRSIADRRPAMLSGGQRQRVAIAAALACGPRLLIADEPVTALDVSVQAQILNLINDLREELNLAVLLISHDLSVVGHLSDRVIVLRQGRMVESGPTSEILSEPRHTYTKELLSAIPGQGRLTRARGRRLEPDPQTSA